MGAELFKMMAGIDFKLVQFKGSGPAMVDLLGGHSHFIFSNLTQVLTHIKSGMVKALAIGSTKRSDILPDIPTIAEAGVPGFENDAWQGIIAPAGTPKPIVDRLYKELSVILTSEDMKKMFEEQGGGVDLIGPTEVGAFIEREMTKWAHVVKTAKIKLE
jgi:tripartite-type tricarboxylate transporter receptor subunit TctC